MKRIALPIGWRIVRSAHHSNAARWERRMGGSPRRWDYSAIHTDGRRVGYFPTARGARAAAVKTESTKGETP